MRESGPLTGNPKTLQKPVREIGFFGLLNDSGCSPGRGINSKKKTSEDVQKRAPKTREDRRYKSARERGGEGKIGNKDPRGEKGETRTQRSLGKKIKLGRSKKRCRGAYKKKKVIQPQLINGGTSLGRSG